MGEIAHIGKALNIKEQNIFKRPLGKERDMEVRIDQNFSLVYNDEHDQIDVLVDVSQDGEAHVCATSLNKDDVIHAIAFLSECLHGGKLT